MSDIVGKTAAWAKETYGKAMGDEEMEKAGHEEYTKLVGEEKLKEDQVKREEELEKAKNDPAVKLADNSMNQTKYSLQQAISAIEEKIAKWMGYANKEGSAHEEKAKAAGELKLAQDERAKLQKQLDAKNAEEKEQAQKQTKAKQAKGEEQAQKQQNQ
ncbi:hypothetical protein COEREDRAFT_80283 [Coemansia reversa NRRL 1564]|uniref:Uncharacterized protein n=1 Tax=Coemansia reversa (strain ATCC 12441 / NRRL 1564) TaxID=763665 RepID=A0A2G5BG63_COERN|nr:hypothetical protein COEREDRAFT_80283 [Coemansia reversa NRRL 1564]|eukprot:PIA17991.1 hypothetical protein COEREDRAFT_80283 [Coemansia reversa NRRL 1564]